MMNKENTPACCAASRNAVGSIKSEPTLQKSEADSMEKLIELKGGKFLMGKDDEEGFIQDGEGPAREITLGPLYIGETTVTNLQFYEFVKTTGYITEVERFGWSFVFIGLLAEIDKEKDFQVAAQTPWWYAFPGAKWNQPEGVGSQIKERMNHPVVHVSWNDAMAYCQWSHKRLPIEAEWECAARGGLVQKKFPWGDELMQDNTHHCNIWQGSFPDYNSMEDGYFGTAPAKSFAPNNFGLYNTSGNVWGWCNDWFSADFHKNGPAVNTEGPPGGQAKVMRGGSFLCHHSYCNRYRVAARSNNTPDSSCSNIGFRRTKSK